MSPKNTPLYKQASQELIAADAKFFRDFAFDPHPDSFRSAAVLALMPFLSAFAYESAKYIERTDPTAVLVLKSNEEMLFWSRMRMKLTEDKYKSSAQVLENVEELIAINSGWFLEGHRGALGPLVRLAQPDLGVTFMNNEAIHTTHIAFLNLGLTKEALSGSSLSMATLGPFMHDQMSPVGQYTSWLVSKLNLGAYTPPGSPATPPVQVRDRDMKSKRLYKSIARQVAPGRARTSILLTWMLSQINTARIVVPQIARQNELAALKIRFVSLYQSALSLENLLEDKHESSFLLPKASERIRDIVNAEPVQNVLQNKNLRNDFVHYGVRKSMSPQLSPSLPLYGLVEAHTSGKSLSDIANDVDLGLDLISNGLRALLPQELASQGTLVNPSKE